MRSVATTMFSPRAYTTLLAVERIGSRKFPAPATLGPLLLNSVSSMSIAKVPAGHSAATIARARTSNRAKDGAVKHPEAEARISSQALTVPPACPELLPGAPGGPPVLPPPGPEAPAPPPGSGQGRL